MRAHRDSGCSPETRAVTDQRLTAVPLRDGDVPTEAVEHYGGGFRPGCAHAEIVRCVPHPSDPDAAIRDVAPACYTRCMRRCMRR